MSFLSTFGKDFKAVFAWIASPKGQVVIGATEAGIAAAVPAAGPVLGLINTWGSEILKTEALAAAAAQQTGSGTQKAAAVITAVTPTALSLFPSLNTAQFQTINNALVLILNTLGTVSTPATTAAPPAPPAAPAIAFVPTPPPPPAA